MRNESTHCSTIFRAVFKHELSLPRIYILQFILTNSKKYHPMMIERTFDGKKWKKWK